MKSEHLTFRYFENAKRNVLTDLSLTFPDGKVTVLLGASGCGKSTLAAVLCGLYPENGGYLESGSCFIEDTDVFSIPFSQRCRYIAAMFQNPDLQFCMGTLREELYFCLENVRVPREEMDALIAENAAKYHVEALLDRPLSELSGGEKQKAALVCLMMLRPKVLVLDEPFANLDPDSTRDYLALLRQEIRTGGQTVIAIDHKAANWLGTADYFLPLDEKCQPAADLVLIPTERLAESASLLETLGIENPFSSCIVKNASFGNEEILRFNNLSVYHQKHEKNRTPQLHDISGIIHRGEVVACLGPSGSGKTTFLMALLGQKPCAGEITLNGQPLGKIRKRALYEKIGIVFQNPAIQFVTTAVQKEVEESLRFGQRKDGKTDEQRAMELLTEFHLHHYRRYSPFMLSQGQQRRLAVLTMLAGGQEILLLDEPTYGQDARTTAAVMDELENRVRQGTTVLFTTHDRQLALRYADRIWYFENGTVRELSGAEKTRLLSGKGGSNE